ncbi:type I-C CRISPR-associated endonuclease Cas1c [Fontivita pretiosa]|uniref:type I-C CRISPR-associated endonuclease Cas1c n=1 Tax=Fontivita pretiosa TaxID=2989684 RepID=UPI003D17C5C4
MKQHLNTLFVTTQGAYLARQGESVLVRVQKQTRLQVPVHNLGGIVCFGRVGASPSLMGLCGERGVGISFMSRQGRFLARVSGFTSGNVLLRRQQYRAADDPGHCAAIARAMVLGKIANSRQVLLRGTRDYPQSPGAAALQQAANRLGQSLHCCPPNTELDRVRGIEGECAAEYFAAFDHLITAQKQSFSFRQRSRRPPLDPINALLSFLYALLTADARCACEAVGLDPAVGFLHRDRPGRPGLALDLMEELRPVLADRLALSLINRRQISPDGFVVAETAAVSMDDNTRRAVLVAYQKRKQEQISHPFLNEKVSVGLILHLQALLLARHLRGDLDAYPPFIWQ